MRTLTEKLQTVGAERDALLAEKEASLQTSTQEAEELLSRVTSVSRERDELQGALQGLRQEKEQLRAELEDRVEMLQTQVCARELSRSKLDVWSQKTDKRKEKQFQKLMKQNIYLPVSVTVTVT